MPCNDGEGDHVWGTAQENWPEAVAELALPSDRIDLSREDRAACLACARGAPARCSEALLAEIGYGLKICPDGAHIRFGLGSFKMGPQPPRFHTVNDFLAVLHRPNPRLAALLNAYERSDHDASLFLTPWRDIEKHTEFRVFIRNGNIIGVSQYHTGNVFPEISQRADEISAIIKAFLINLIPKMHLESFTADLHVDPDRAPGDNCILLELNPLIRRTDACLFDWNRDPAFDGTFRYIGA